MHMHIIICLMRIMIRDHIQFASRFTRISETKLATTKIELMCMHMYPVQKSLRDNDVDDIGGYPT